uniref:Uncharacterized protein n=1 Tax=Musca domestica TaxID=7370 RepID=A0A1I8M659_MUSDO
MSEPLSNDVSTESLCTVIETSSNEYLSNKFNKDPIKCVSLESLDTNRISPTSNNLKTNGCLRNSLDESCDTDTTEKSINNATTEEEGDGGLEKKPKTKLKKSVSFDPNDEKIKKFIAGEPIVDQQNPFKSNGYLSTTNGGSSKRKDKKTPPPVPAKRSTLSVRKTVTQQLREREREKEKERERQKNEANNRKSNGIIKSPSDEFVTTEEVLKQSKYVKTYIKNPDPYFVYDPTVLARLKFEELRDLALKKPPKRIVTQNTPQPQPRERLKELKNRQNENKPSKPPITFKKCSKPNYPDLSDLKIKTGTVLEDSLYNPLEVTKNAKKFDERVKKLHISSDDDLDEIEEPLTKSESSDDNNMSGTQQEETGKMPQSENNNGAADPCGSSREPSPPPTGTFTNTIKSKEFQEYLEKKGLTLIPKKIPNGAQPMYGKKSPTSGGTIKQISFKAEPERIQFSSSGGGSDSVDAAGRNKPSVFQRLLANSIFASRRKTTPKEPVPIIKPSYGGNQENGSLKPIKRVVLERQSFHGRPKAGNLLSPAEALELKQQLERSRKSYASGDDISLSISSALANAEHQNGNENLTNSIKSNTIGTPGLRRKELQGKSITKPPRRTLSRERITKYEPPKMVLSERPTNVNNNLYTLAREPASAATAREKNDTSFRRTIDRQSMIPKRTTQPQDRQQIFGRSSSMDRNEILKRNANRGAQSQQPANQQQRSNSVTGETLLAPITTRSGDNVQETTFPVNDGPPITSTPKRGGESGGGNPSTSINTKNISPISSIPKKASQLGVYVDQQEWERLRAIKEQTDRELYYRVMQQQQKLQQQQQQQQNSHSTSNNSQNQRKEELPARTETVETSKTNSKTKTASTDSNNSKSQATNSERDRSKNECKQESATPPTTTTENTMYVSNSSNSSLSSSSSSSSSTSNSSSSSTASNGNLSSETTTTQQIQKSNSVEEPLASATETTTTAASPPATNITTSDSLEKSATCPFTESIERTAANIPDNFSVFGNKNKSPLYNGINSSIDEGDKIKNSIESTQSATLLSTTIADVPKLSLFDDRSFFSLNPDKISQMPPLQQQQQHTASLLNNKLLEDPLLTGRTMPNLPDLINGIDGYQSNLNCSNDWEDAFKSVILKTNKQMEEKMQQQQQLQQHLNSHLHLKTQEDLRKLQELQKRNILLNSMRVSQLGGPLGPLGSDLGRHSHFMAQQNPLLQHQPNLSSENLLQNSAQLPFETNMSKFFDFHKHQQQQKLQHYGGGIGGPAAGGLGSLSDNFHMMSLLENKPLNSQLLDPNSLLNSHLQQQQQKQKQQLYGKMDPMMHHQQQLQQQQALNKNLSNMHGNQNHLKSQYLQNSNADDDLGFDPFIETQKALAELIENEEEQQQLQQHNHVPTSHSNPIGPPKQPQTQPTPPHQQDPMLEYMQRLRMPPPGFSHHNSNLGGYGGMDPRMHSNQNSKMLPFMNLPGTNNGGAGNPPHMAPQQQQTHPLQMPNPNVWSSHLGNMQQQQQQGMGLRHDNLGQPQNMGNQKPGYSSGGGSDWTAMDPAILSFRQFSFPQQQQQNQMGPPQMPPPPQQQQQQPPPQDMFLQHLSQQAAGFGLGGGPPGGNGQMPNGQHHNSQGHLNVDASVQGMLEYLKTHQFV